MLHLVLVLYFETSFIMSSLETDVHKFYLSMFLIVKKVQQRDFISSFSFIQLINFFSFIYSLFLRELGEVMITLFCFREWNKQKKSGQV